jgi:hypothetical protein
MPRSSAEELAIESRRCHVAELFLRGVKRQGELAGRLGVDRSTVSRDLKVLNARWKEAALRDLDAAKGQELERIDLVEHEYWTAWENSKQNRETTTTEQVTGGDGDRTRAAIRKEDQHGDPRYLAGVQWCIEQRCKILGLYAAAQVDVRVLRERLVAEYTRVFGTAAGGLLAGPGGDAIASVVLPALPGPGRGPKPPAE